MFVCVYISNDIHTTHHIDNCLPSSPLRYYFIDYCFYSPFSVFFYASLFVIITHQLYKQLNQQSLSESEVKEDDNETEHASAATNLEAGPAAVSKKKKKKRKKKSKYTGNHISSEDNEVSVLLYF